MHNIDIERTFLDCIRQLTNDTTSKLFDEVDRGLQTPLLEVLWDQLGRFITEMLREDTE